MRTDVRSPLHVSFQQAMTLYCRHTRRLKTRYNAPLVFFSSREETVLPILNSSTDSAQLDALRAKLSLKPLLLEGLDDETGEAGKFEVVRAILRDVQKRGDQAVIVGYDEESQEFTVAPLPDVER